MKQTQRILIVDDNAQNLYLLRALLEGNGYIVDDARHGAEALSKARQTAPDLVISDLLMPVMDGYTLLRHWKSDEQLKHIPFVVYTATYVEPGDEKLALDLGADAFILKPSEPDVFVKRIDEILSRKKTGELAELRQPAENEKVLLKEYNEALIHKLEKKLFQLQQTLDALHEAEERQRLAMEAADLGMWFWDIKADRLEWTPQSLQLFGLPPDQKMTYEFFLECLHPDDRARTDTAVKDALAHRSDYRIEFRTIRPDSTVHWISAMGRALFDEKGDAVRMMGVVQDITERRRVETRLREMQVRLELANRASQIGLWDWDLRTNQMYFSPEWKRQLGYEDHEINDRYEEWEERLHPEDREHVLAVLHDFLAGKRSDYEVEFRLRHKDGSWRWIFTRGELFLDAAGEPSRLLGCHLDVTGHKEAETALRHERDFSDSVLNSLPGVFYLYDENLHFLRWNKNFEHVTGYTGAEIARMTPQDFFTGPDKKLLTARIQEVFDKGFSEVEADFVSKDGTRTPYYFNGFRTRIDGITCLLGIGVDIRARKRVEQDLKESEERQRLAMEAADLGMWFWDIKADRLEWTPQSLQLFGLPPDQKMTYEFFLECLHPDDRARTDTAVKDALAHRSDYRIEFRTIRPDSTVHWISAMGRALFDEKGDAVRMMGVVQDITERKHMEAVLQESNERFTKAFRSSPLAISISRLADGRFIDVNDMFLKMFDYKREEVIGQTSLELKMWFDPEDRARLADELRSKGAFRNREFRYHRKTGLTGWTLSSAEIIELNGEPYVISLFNDITERKLAEEVISQSEQRLRSILDTMFVFVGLIDLDGRIVEVNNAPVEAAGLKREDVLGRTVPESYWFSYSPAVQEQIHNALSLAAKGETVREDYTIRISGEQKIVIDTTFAPLRDDTGEVIQIVGSAVDIPKENRQSRHCAKVNYTSGN